METTFATGASISLEGLKEIEPTVIEKVKEIEAKELTIKDIDDKEGYEKVNKARMELVRLRTGIEKVGKAIRDEAVQFQKTVIARENQLIQILTPLEHNLKAMQKSIDDEIEEIEKAKTAAAEKVFTNRVNEL